MKMGQRKIWLGEVVFSLVIGIDTGGYADGVSYRAVPVHELPYSSPLSSTGGICAFPSWPADPKWGSAVRSRFVTQTRVIANTSIVQSDDLVRRRAVILDRDAVDGSWEEMLLPLPPGFIESVAVDANASGIVVGACLYRESLGSPLRSVAVVWRLGAQDPFASTVEFVFHPWSGGACGGVGESYDSFVDSSFVAVGPVDAVGKCFAAGVVNTLCFQAQGDVFGLSIHPESFDALHRLGGGALCETVAESCDGTRIGRVGAIGADSNGQPWVFGSVAQNNSGIHSLCADKLGWWGCRWTTHEEITVRKPFVCTDLPPEPFPAANGVWGLDLGVHISSVFDGNDGNQDVPIAGGAIEFELRSGPEFDDDWGWCDSYGICEYSHAAVFTKPYSGPEEIALNIHYAIEAPQTDVYVQSDVARVGAAIRGDGRWVAVGARSPTRSLETGEPDGASDGVIWVGKTREQSHHWCGRSMSDESVIQKKCRLAPNGPIQELTIQAVHDVLSSGVALGIGTLGSSDPSSRRYLVLLTEVSDIDGDQRVNGVDLGMLLSAWGTPSPNGECDLDGDGNVTATDLTMILSHWGFGETGRGAEISGLCGDEWAEIAPLPIHLAIHAIGFENPDEFSTVAVSLPRDSAVSLCCFVVDVARSLTNP